MVACATAGYYYFQVRASLPQLDGANAVAGASGVDLDRA